MCIYPRGDIGQQEDDTPYVRSMPTISSKIVIQVLSTTLKCFLECNTSFEGGEVLAM